MCENYPSTDCVPLQDVLSWVNDASDEVRKDRQRLEEVLELRPDVASSDAVVFARGKLVGQRAVLASFQAAIMAHNADVRMLQDDQQPDGRQSVGQLYLFE